MDSIKIMKKGPVKVPFGVTLPDSYSVLNINILDTLADDIVLHIDFRYTENKIVFNKRIGQVWGEEQAVDCPYEGGLVSGEISISDAGFVLHLGDQDIAFDADRPVEGKEIRLYSDFRFITIGVPGSADLAYARRWPFFLADKRPAGPGSKLRQMQEMPARREGLTGLLLWNNYHENAEALLRRAASTFDEVLIVIHDAANADLGFILHLQSRYFNVRYVVLDKVYYNNHDPRKLKGAAFLNTALTEARFANVMLLSDSVTDADALVQLVRKHRLRTRSDAFLLASAKPESATSDVLAFSIKDGTYFVDGVDGSPVFAENDLARRHVVMTERLAMLAGREWSIDATEMLAVDGRPRAQVVVEALNKGRSFTMPKRAKLVFLIISCRRNRDKQDAIRKTWINDLSTGNFEFCFVEGDPSAESARLDGDRLFVPAPDTYEYLSHKVWHAFKAAAELFDAAYFFKIDDDCVCNVEKFMECEYERFDYIGSDIVLGKKTFIDWHYNAVFNRQLSALKFGIDPDQNWFDGQGGYIVSRAAVDKIIASDIIDFQHMLEDYAVGSCLKATGIDADMTVSEFQSIRAQYITTELDYGRAVVTDIPDLEMYDSVYQKFRALNDDQRRRISSWRLDIKSE